MNDHDIQQGRRVSRRVICVKSRMREGVRTWLLDPGPRRGDEWPLLKNFRRVIRKPRALAAQQRDVSAVRPALEAVDHVSQS